MFSRYFVDVGLKEKCLETDNFILEMYSFILCIVRGYYILAQGIWEEIPFPLQWWVSIEITFRKILWSR